MDVNELFAAIKSGDAAKVQKIIDAEPSLVEARSPEGLSPLMVALYHQQPKIADLIKARARNLDIFEAAAAGDAARVAELLSKNPSLVNEVSPDGFTPLGLAAFFGRAEVVEMLLDRGADPNAASRNAMKVTPLHSAVTVRDPALAVKLAKTLIAHGARVNVAQHGGWTPLQSAAAHGNTELVRLLLDSSADPSVLSDDGRSALDFARKDGHEAVAALLESRMSK